MCCPGLIWQQLVMGNSENRKTSTNFPLITTHRKHPILMISNDTSDKETVQENLVHSWKIRFWGTTAGCCCYSNTPLWTPINGCWCWVQKGLSVRQGSLGWTEGRRWCQSAMTRAQWPGTDPSGLPSYTWHSEGRGGGASHERKLTGQQICGSS